MYVQVMAASCFSLEEGQDTDRNIYLADRDTLIEGVAWDSAGHKHHICKRVAIIVLDGKVHSGMVEE